MDVIHISYGGPDYYIIAGGRVWFFEDHPYCGPCVLDKRTKDPVKNQPDEKSPFWKAVTNWYQSGKKTKNVCGKIWAVVE